MAICVKKVAKSEAEIERARALLGRRGYIRLANRCLFEATKLNCPVTKQDRKHFFYEKNKSCRFFVWVTCGVVGSVKISRRLSCPTLSRPSRRCGVAFARERFTGKRSIRGKKIKIKRKARALTRVIYEMFSGWKKNQSHQFDSKKMYIGLKSEWSFAAHKIPHVFCHIVACSIFNMFYPEVSHYYAI